MPLTRHSESSTIYLEAKHFCLWRQIKKPVGGCETLEVNNPKTGQKVTKYGYRYDTVAGFVTSIEKYDTQKKYSTRYFGFKLHMTDGTERYVIDMPYQSQILRRFLRVAAAVEWDSPLSITVFKGKAQKNGESETTGVWFQQRGCTVKPFYTREEPHGMPDASYDEALQQWDFRAQHRWLVEKLQDEIIPAIEAAAKFPPRETGEPLVEPAPEDREPAAPAEDWQASDDDVPF